MSAGAEPSAEAVGKAHWTLKRGAKPREALAAAYAIDAPAIRAEGYAAGRDEALREVVAFLRATLPQRGRGLNVNNEAADAIEDAFPTTGETT